MIKLSIDQTELQKQLKLKVEAIGEMKKPYFLEEVAKAAFTLVGEKFVLAADRFAVQNPKRMHHVYEWKELGKPRARLFVIERISVLNGSLIINSSFLPSKVPVPINPELLIPGKSGRYVNKQSIFKNKADVMEKGLPVVYKASSTLAFAGRNGNMFLKPGTIVSIKNPGGVATKNSFTAFMLDWYNTNAEMIMNSSGLYERIANEASRILSEDSGGMTAIKTMVAQITDIASRGLVEIK
jgi:hypothetical protein